MGLFIRKPFEALQAEANASGKKTLKRVLGPWSLVALGVGVIIGAGLFSITGTVAAGYTGPAITLSFAIAALGCCFAGLSPGSPYGRAGTPRVCLRGPSPSVPRTATSPKGGGKKIWRNLL